MEMSDIKLFKTATEVVEIPATSVALERNRSLWNWRFAGNYKKS